MSVVWPVIIITGGTIVAVLFITTLMPFFTQIVSTTNTTIAASSNFTNYPGSQGAILSAPFWLYFIPVIVGLIAIVQVLVKHIRGR